MTPWTRTIKDKVTTMLRRPILPCLGMQPWKIHLRLGRIRFTH